MTGQDGKQKVLVTGANGVIGRAVREFLGDRYELSALTRRPVDFPSHVADTTDLEGIQPAFEGVDAVVHLASSASVSTPWDDILNNNIVGTYNVYEAARRAGVKRVVFASSNHTIGMYELDGAPSIYEIDDPRVYDHTAELRPDSYYGVAKVFAEALGRYYHDNYGMAFVNLRIGTVREDDRPDAPEVYGSVPEPLERLTMEERRKRLRSTWLSRRDCCELIAAGLDTDATWAVVYGISDNPRQFWDLSHARELIGYDPKDSAPV